VGPFLMFTPEGFPFSPPEAGFLLVDRMGGHFVIAEVLYAELGPRVRGRFAAG